MMKVAVCAFLLTVLVHCTAATYSNVNVPLPYYRCRPCLNTCRYATCPRYRGAVCWVTPCTCQPRWFLRTSYYGYYSGYLTDVTAKCFIRPYVPVPYSMPGPLIPGPVVEPVGRKLPEHEVKPMPSPNATESPSEEPVMTMESPAPTPVGSPQPVEVESAHSHVYVPSPHRSPYPCQRCSDTCRHTTCPRFSNAVCHVTRCTCQPRWYFGGKDVTAQCFTHPGPYNIHVPRPAVNPAPVVHYFPVPEVEPRRPMPSSNATESPSEELMTMKSPAPSPASSP